MARRRTRRTMYPKIFSGLKPPEMRFASVMADILWEFLLVVAVGIRCALHLAVACLISIICRAKQAKRMRRQRRSVLSKSESADFQSTPPNQNSRVSRGNASGNPSGDMLSSSLQGRSEVPIRPEDEETPSGFDDVIGLEQVKEEIQMKAILPLVHWQLASHYGLSVGGGVLLVGPPGTGKSLIARAVAHEIDAPFFPITTADLLSNQVGQAERNVRQLFSRARNCGLSVVFVDELESLAPVRRNNRSTIMARVVPQMLQEWQGVVSSSKRLLVMAATNEPWSIDPAFLRPGRFDAIIGVPLPGRKERLAMLTKFLENRPLDPNLDLESLADHLDGYSGADIACICELAARIPFRQAIEGNTKEHRMIHQEDLARATKRTRRSVMKEQLDQLQRWLNDHDISVSLANAG